SRSRSKPASRITHHASRITHHGKNHSPSREDSVLLRAVLFPRLREVGVRLAAQDLVGACDPGSERRFGKLELERGLAVAPPPEVAGRDHLAEGGPEGADVR